MAIAPISPPPTGYTEGICATYTPVSEVFTFNVRTICNRAGVDQLQLMFKNRYGMYDYYTFTAGKSEGLNIERQTYKTQDQLTLLILNSLERLRETEISST